MPTRREELAEILRRDAYTAKELARETGAKVRDVIDDLQHLQRSFGRAFQIEAAFCDACGFEFKTRKRLGAPSRCPECRSERIRGPHLRLRK